MSGKPTPDRLPPHANEAEQGILGSVLDVMGSAALALDKLAAQRFEPEFFYDLRHRTIFEAMLKLREANTPVDIITVQQSLRDGGTLEDIGGIVYLNELQDSVTGAGVLGHYADMVRGKAMVRAFVNKCGEFQQRALAAEDVAKVIAEASGELLELATVGQYETAWKPLKQIVQDVISDMEEFRYVRGKTQLRGLPTGPQGVYLDKLLRGIRETYYMVLAGRPGDGKTTKAMNILEHLALDYVWHEPTGKKLLNHETNEEYPETVERKGIPVAVFSIEMDSTSLGYRLLFGRAGVDTAEFSQGFASNDDNVNLIKVAGKLSNAQVWVDDTPGQTIGQIAAKARQIAAFREEQAKNRALGAKGGRLTLESLQAQIAEGGMKELPVIIKADVQGSAEVLADTLAKLSDDKVKIRIIHSGVGAVTESDVLLGTASKAIIIAFNVRPDRNAESVANREGVDIRQHTIIYNVTDEMKKAMVGLLEPTFKEVRIGVAQVRDIFKVPKFGTIAGCMVTEGRITRSGDTQARLLRQNVVVFEGKIGSLRRFKDDVGEVKTGFECGIGFDKYNELLVGDVIEVFTMERIVITA